MAESKVVEGINTLDPSPPEILSEQGTCRDFAVSLTLAIDRVIAVFDGGDDDERKRAAKEYRVGSAENFLRFNAGDELVVLDKVRWATARSASLCSRAQPSAAGFWHSAGELVDGLK